MAVVSRPYFSLTIVASRIDTVVELFASLKLPQLAPVPTEFLLPMQPYSATEAIDPMILWSPMANPQLTAFMPNVMCGNYFFSQYLTTRFKLGAIEIRSTSDDVKSPINELATHERGERVRVVRAMQDENRWDFYAEGVPRKYEDTQRYLAHKVRNRFGRSHLLCDVESWGAAICDPSFWRTEVSAFTFRRN